MQNWLRLLDEHWCGETAKRQHVSHLLYIDDLKLYGRNPDQLKGLLHTVRTFSDDIQIKFGLDTLSTASSLDTNSGVTVEKTDTINCLEPGQVYKYLGVDESNDIQHSTMQEILHREHFHRVKMVLRTKMYDRNKILAINGFALPVLTYCFGVIHWQTTDLQQLDRWTRKLLSMYNVHHPKRRQTLTGCTLRGRSRATTDRVDILVLYCGARLLPS